MTTHQRLIVLYEEGPRVAEFLLEQGITGLRKAPGCCPVAKYLGNDSIVTLRAIGIRNPVWQEFPTTYHLREFIIGFDRGDYPELER